MGLPVLLSQTVRAADANPDELDRKLRRSVGASADPNARSICVGAPRFDSNREVWILACGERASAR